MSEAVENLKMGSKRWVQEHIPSWLVAPARAARSIIYEIATPIDRLALVIQGKRELPSLQLRREVGDLAKFEASGSEFVAYLKLLCNLRSSDAVLDIGCGCGQLALYLEESLQPGSYIGFDVQKRPIEWCQRHIMPRRKNFQFFHFDSFNGRYNPTGPLLHSDSRLPIPDRSIDCAVAKSVFTHLLPEETNWYFRELSRMMKPNGRVLLSFFLTGEYNGHAKYRFEFGNSDFRYEFASSPETAVAYPLERIEALAASHNLKVCAVRYGSWSGRLDALSFQDLVLLAPVH